MWNKHLPWKERIRLIHSCFFFVEVCRVGTNEESFVEFPCADEGYECMLNSVDSSFSWMYTCQDRNKKKLLINCPLRQFCQKIRRGQFVDFQFPHRKKGFIEKKFPNFRLRTNKGGGQVSWNSSDIRLVFLILLKACFRYTYH